MEEYYDRSSFRPRSESKHWGRKKPGHKGCNIGLLDGQAGEYCVMLRSNGERTVSLLSSPP